MSTNETTEMNVTLHEWQSEEQLSDLQRRISKKCPIIFQAWQTLKHKREKHEKERLEFKLDEFFQYENRKNAKLFALEYIQCEINQERANDTVKVKDIHNLFGRGQSQNADAMPVAHQVVITHALFGRNLDLKEKDCWFRLLDDGPEKFAFVLFMIDHFIALTRKKPSQSWRLRIPLEIQRYKAYLEVFFEMTDKGFKYSGHHNINLLKEELTILNSRVNNDSDGGMVKLHSKPPTGESHSQKKRCMTIRDSSSGQVPSISFIPTNQYFGRVDSSILELGRRLPSHGEKRNLTGSGLDAQEPKILKISQEEFVKLANPVPPEFLADQDILKHIDCCSKFWPGGYVTYLKNKKIPTGFFDTPALLTRER